MRKKRSFSLIEMLICFTLFSLLTTSLFFWYRNLSNQKLALQQVRWPLLQERYAHQRLQNILPRAQGPFFSEYGDNSLVFTFDRGPYSDPQLSEKVLAKLHLDQNNLVLSIWPMPEKDGARTPSQTYILLEEVSEAHFEFYSPPDLLKKPVDPAQIGLPLPQEGWQNSWSAHYPQLPAFIKLEIKKEHPLTFVFDLPTPIIHPKQIGAA